MFFLCASIQIDGQPLPVAVTQVGDGRAHEPPGLTSFIYEAVVRDGRDNHVDGTARQDDAHEEHAACAGKVLHLQSRADEGYRQSELADGDTVPPRRV